MRALRISLFVPYVSLPHMVSGVDVSLSINSSFLSARINLSSFT